MDSNYISYIIFIISIIFISIGIARAYTEEAKPPKECVRYVPRTLEEDAKEPVKVTDIFKSMFEQQAPWIGNFDDGNLFFRRTLNPDGCLIPLKKRPQNRIGLKKNEDNKMKIIGNQPLYGMKILDGEMSMIVNATEQNFLRGMNLKDKDNDNDEDDEDNDDSENSNIPKGTGKFDDDIEITKYRKYESDSKPAADPDMNNDDIGDNTKKYRKEVSKMQKKLQKLNKTVMKMNKFNNKNIDSVTKINLLAPDVSSSV
jgi:hypothetical protein